MDESADVLRLIGTFEKDGNLTPQEAPPFRSDRRPLGQRSEHGTTQCLPSGYFGNAPWGRWQPWHLWQRGIHNLQSLNDWHRSESLSVCHNTINNLHGLRGSSGQ